jgi:hypothetical protein
MLSSFGFNFNLRRYSEERLKRAAAEAEVRAVAAEAGPSNRPSVSSNRAVSPSQIIRNHSKLR